jgi:hypothetical protein
MDEELAPRKVSRKTVRIGFLSDGPYEKGEVPIEFLVGLAVLCARPTALGSEPITTCELCPKTETHHLEQELKRQLAFFNAWKAKFVGSLDAQSSQPARISFEHSARLIEALKSHMPFQCPGAIECDFGETTYVAPAIIFHYVVAHNFRPSQEFIEAVASSIRAKGTYGGG